jgi:hypothetical protein
MTSVKTQVDSSMARSLERSADFERHSMDNSMRMSADKSLSASGFGSAKNPQIKPITSSATGPKQSYKSTPQSSIDGYLKKTSNEVRNV